MHWPPALQMLPPGHVPQLPPHPSEPQVLPEQAGVHTQAPAAEQVVAVPHVPQEPVQPSLPHALPVQSGVQVVPGEHWPAALQFSLGPQAPHSPPHPSPPQARPAQEGVQVELANEVSQVRRCVSSQEASGAPGGIVLSIMRVRMRSLHLRTSASLSKSTPTVAPARSRAVRLTE